MVIALKKHYWLFLLFLLAGLVARWHFYKDVDKRLVEKLSCHDVVQGCGNGMLNVQFSQSPQILKPFVVTIKTDANAVVATFDMQSMEMGLNRYRFNKVGDGIWQAEVILPVCVQGRSDWVMQLELKRTVANLHYQVQFNASR